MTIAKNVLLPEPTPRLRLRHWTEADKAPFSRINADPKVMACFPAPLSPTESDALAERIMRHQATHGFCFWALELRESSTFIGFVGLAIPQWPAPFMPTVEIGWRLACEHWGQGYATEAARAALAFGFDQLQLDEILAYTASSNLRSQHVMQRLGMWYAPQDNFLHPALPETHPLAPHVLYRLSCAESCS
jgi:RimJ/RimL family protein N-acetyltransferase